MRSMLIRSFLVGVASGALGVATSFLIRYYVGGIFLPELATQTLIALVPGQLESRAVENLGSLAKYATFGGAIALNVLLYGFLSILLYRHYGHSSAKDYQSLAVRFGSLSYGVFTAVALVFAAFVSQSAPVGLVALSLIPPNFLFGAALPYLVPRVVARREVICLPPSAKKRPFDRRRRLFIRVGAAATIATVLLVYGLDVLFTKMGVASKTAADVTQLFSLEVTPNEKFYRVDINVIPPNLNPKAWSLGVDGLVDHPLTLSYDELLALPAVEHYNTLECVSNKVGGDLMSTAKWKGVRLMDVLQKAGVHPDAEYAVFSCTDGYDVGIPVDRALLDGTLLAYEMNGFPLPVEHGHPLRAVVPGLYGMMNAKWLLNIQLVKGNYEGFWQRRGWTSDARYQLGSTIVTPGGSGLRARFDLPDSASNVSIGDETIAGVAFAGDIGISKVEVSTDGGSSWQQASFKDPLSQYTWVLWRAAWNPPKEGPYQLVVRATDASGNVQTATLHDPFPNGATGYHVVDVNVGPSQ